jgi:hypothetical protein
MVCFLMTGTSLLSGLTGLPLAGVWVMPVMVEVYSFCLAPAIASGRGHLPFLPGSANYSFPICHLFRLYTPDAIKDEYCKS